MTAREQEAAGQSPPGGDRQVDHFRHVGEVVDREPDGLRPERLQLAPVVSMRENLEIEQPYVVAGLPDRGRDALQAERFEPQVDLRIHESAGMDEQDAHGSMTSAAAARGVAFILNSALCSGPMNRESLRVGPEHRLPAISVLDGIRQA